MDKFITVSLLVLSLSAGWSEVIAQDLSTRYGLGAGAIINPSNSEVSEDDLGLDVRVRISQPVSGALSLAADLGTFVFTNAEQTEFVLNPQVMVIATLGGDRRFPYLLAGVGAVLPAEQDRDSQLEVHAGYGWAWPFGARMSAFVEVNPLIAFRREGVAIMVPVRGGFIF